MVNMLNEIYNTKSLSELNVLRREIDKAFEKQTNTLNIKECAFNATKGTLGAIKENFENMSPELFKTNEGRKMIAAYKGIIKENKSLSTAIKVFENFRKAFNANAIDYVINDIEKYTEDINTKQLHEGISKLKEVLYKSYIMLGKEAEQYCINENYAYNEAIMYLIENKRKLSNSINFANASEIIKENIENRINEKKDYRSDLINNIDNAFNGYFSQNIETEEVKMDNKELAFETYKNECMSKINEVIESMKGENVNEDELSKIKTIYEQVSEKKYSVDTVNNDIKNLIGITKCFE